MNFYLKSYQNTQSEPMKRAIAYTRISMKEQSTFSLSGQKKQISLYAERREVEVVQHYEEDGRSAKTFNRPVWKQMIAYLKANKKDIDILLIAKYDRLIRNATQGMQLIEDLHKKYEVRVVSVMEDIGLSPDDPMFFKVQADYLVMADFENRVRSDRTKAGMHQANLQGYYKGPAPFGYSNTTVGNSKTIIKHEEKAAIVSDVFDMYLGGLTFKEISSALGERRYLKGHSAIRRVLENPTYAGLVKVKSYRGSKPQIIEAVHEPIVSRLKWERAQVLLQEPTTIRKTLNPAFPLRGLILSEKCQTPMTAAISNNGKKRRKRQYGYYKCNTCGKESTSSIATHEQLGDILKGLKLSTHVIEAVKKRTVQKIKAMLKDRAIRARQVSAQIEVLTERIDNLEEKYIQDKIEQSTYQKWSTRYKNEKVGLGVELEQLQKKESGVLELYETQLPRLQNLHFLYEAANIEEKRKLFVGLFGEEVTKTKTGYRTPYILPLFAPIAHGIKELEIIDTCQNEENNGKSQEVPIMGRKSNPATNDEIVTFLRVIERINVAA